MLRYQYFEGGMHALHPPAVLNGKPADLVGGLGSNLLPLGYEAVRASLVRKAASG